MSEQWPRDEQIDKQAITRLRVINQISRVISGSLSLNSILDDTVVAINQLLDFYNIGILLVNPDEPELLVLRAGAGIFAPFLSPKYQQRIDQGLIGEACLLKRYVLINDVQHHPRYLPIPGGESIYSELAVPILLGQRLLGILNLESEQPIGEDSADDLQTVADQLAVAIENARLFDIEQQRARRSSVLAQISRQISRSLNTESVLQDAVQAIHTHLGFPDVALFVLDENSPDWLVLRARAGISANDNIGRYRQHISQGVLGEAIRLRDTIVVADVSQDTRYVPSVPNIKSELATPIFQGDELLGLLNIESDRRLGPLDAGDFQIIADQLRSSISNAHRYEEEKRRTERLALIARTGQRIAARLTRDELIDTLVNELHDQLGYEHAALFLLDPDDPSHLVQCACATLWPRSVAIGYRLPLNQGVVGAAGRLRTVQQVNDVLQSPIYISMSGVRGEDEPLAELAIPIVLGERLLGVLDLASNREFHDEDEQAAQIIADQIAVAIENAELFHEAQRTLAETHLLYKTSQRISVAMDVPEVITAYLAQVAAQGRFMCSIVLYELDDMGQRSMTVMRGRWTPNEGITHPTDMRIPYSHDELDSILDRGETVKIRDVQDDPRVPPSLRTMQVIEQRPAMAMIPLIVRGERIGLVILTIHTPYSWNETDLQPYQATAAQLATAIDSRRAQTLVYERNQQLAIIEERQRLARELHDSVTQLIFSTTLIAQSISPAWRRSPVEGEKRVNRLLELSQSALAEMRALLLELRPPALDDNDDNRTSIPGLIRVQREGLSSAIRRYANTIARDSLHIELDDSGYPPLTGMRASLALEEGIYRIAQEALNNVVKHAQAQSVHLQLVLHERIVTLTIIDNGRGFAIPGEAHAQNTSGIGLKTMHERAAELKGILRISSTLRQGTTVALSIPWREKRIL